MNKPLGLFASQMHGKEKKKKNLREKTYKLRMKEHSSRESQTAVAGDVCVCVTRLDAGTVCR